MKPTPAILQYEFIGLTAKVVESSHPNYVGIEGRVINETRNTIIITHGNENKTIAKNTARPRREPLFRPVSPTLLSDSTAAEGHKRQQRNGL